jgi:membrane protease YdiL (CAAX protease family)
MTTTIKEKISRVGSFFARISIGIVFLLMWGWFYFRTDTFFPIDTAGWRFYIQTWIIFFGFTITLSLSLIPKYIGEVFRFSFLKEWWKFFASAAMTGIIFYAFIYLVKGSVSVVYLVPLSISLIYAFFVAYPEEIVFRGMIPSILRSRINSKGQSLSKAGVYIIQALLFSAFHFALGRSWTTLIFYFPLALFWMWMKDKYSPQSNMANAGSHFIWDVLLLMFGIAT